jgi:gas vesicle protein
MLLLAPRSGKDTRMQIQEKGLELRDRTNEIVEDTLAQVRSSVNKITLDGREKLKELKQHGQELAVEQLDHVSEAAQAGKKAIQSS